MASIGFAQTAEVKGIVLDENNTPVPAANVTYNNLGTLTNENGFYQLEIPANQEITIKISYVGLKSVTFPVYLSEGESIEFNPVLKTDVEQITTVVITGKERNVVEGLTTISPETIRKIPGANAGVENLLKTLPGVSSNNELSTQYSVRGGNYDENLVYVNEIEVYRPFLIRSGQQEGLSFVNTDMVRDVNFSAGGFQAKYGDKLSSVLDIEYRRPTEFGASLDMSLLGVNSSIEGTTKNQKLSAILGVRYRNNSLFVNSRDIEVDYNPSFIDAQTYITYQVNKKFELGFLGNFSSNKYDYEPVAKETNFGTLQEPKKLVIFYEGQEEDRYQTYFSAIKGSYDVSENFTAKLIASAFNTQEQEHFDILGQYFLSEDVNTNIGGDDLGESEYLEGLGSQLNHARNDLDALIFNIEHKGNYSKNNHQIDYGIKYTHEDIRDRLREYEVIDSAGFTIRPPFDDIENNQPYEPYDAPLEPYISVRAYNEKVINRLQAYAQWSYKTKLNNSQLWLNAGARSHTWTVDDQKSEKITQTVISPRAQVALKPDWKNDIIFRLSGGLYYQPPFYRELRNRNGEVNPDLKAQKSYHIIAGNEYSFKWGKEKDKPMTLITEVYYKDLTDVNPYTIENVRVRYAAENNAKAYAYGFDARLSGELVPGAESWLSFGYLKTQENINDRGYISRPTDQRLKFAVLFQDYIPNIPSIRLYLNMVYNTGLPGGSPTYADPYDYQSRLPNYHRVDAGFSYVIVDEAKENTRTNWLKTFKGLAVGFEIFNVFDRQNSITRTFVRDVYSKRIFGTPNYLTPRLFNLKLSMRF
ncbi:TonB-dependent receptor [Mesonia sp. K7]|nr:TonB-dependent receptor [Mesonia sp. K7]